MTPSWKFSLGAAVATFALTMLTFVAFMFLMWGLAPANLAYALELGATWAPLGACIVGFIVHNFQGRRSTVFAVCLTLWWLASSFLYLTHIARSA